MTLDRKRQVFRTHADPVIRDADQALSTTPEDHVDLAGTGVGIGDRTRQVALSARAAAARAAVHADRDLAVRTFNRDRERRFR